MGYPQKGLIDGSIKKENYLLPQEDRSVTLPFFARNRGYTIDGGSDLYQVLAVVERIPELVEVVL